MNTRPVLGFAVAIAIGALMFQMGGFAGQLQAGGAGGDLQSSGDFQEAANNSSVREGVQGSVNRGNDNLVGLALTGIGSVVNAVGFVALLPFELKKLGLPWYGAYPIGIGGWYAMGFGLVQFGSGRVFR